MKPSHPRRLLQQNPATTNQRTQRQCHLTDSFAPKPSSSITSANPREHIVVSAEVSLLYHQRERYVYVCIYIYRDIHTHIHTYICIYTSMRMCQYTYIYICSYTCICIYTCSLCVYVYIYYMCVYIYMRTSTLRCVMCRLATSSSPILEPQHSGPCGSPRTLLKCRSPTVDEKNLHGIISQNSVKYGNYSMRQFI